MAAEFFYIILLLKNIWLVSPVIILQEQIVSLYSNHYQDCMENEQLINSGGGSDESPVVTKLYNELFLWEFILIIG